MDILLIDDEKNCLDAIESALEPTGFKCTTLTDPEEGLRLYRQERFDVVLTDIRMPKMNGIDLLKAIRSYNGDARVMIITAFDDFETAIEAIDNGAYVIFEKPLNLRELIRVLKTLESDIGKEQALSGKQ